MMSTPLFLTLAIVCAVVGYEAGLVGIYMVRLARKRRLQRELYGSTLDDKWKTYYAKNHPDVIDRRTMS